MDMGLLSRVEPPIVVTLKSFHKTCAKVFTLKKYILLLKAARTAASRSRGMPGKPLDVYDHHHHHHQREMPGKPSEICFG